MNNITTRKFNSESWTKSPHGTGRKKSSCLQHFTYIYLYMLSQKYMSNVYVITSILISAMLITNICTPCTFAFKDTFTDRLHLYENLSFFKHTKHTAFVWHTHENGAGWPQWNNNGQNTVLHVTSKRVTKFFSISHQANWFFFFFFFFFLSVRHNLFYFLVN